MSRLIDADALKRKAQRVATESWKMRLTARIETTLNQFIDWIDNAPTVQPEQVCVATVALTDEQVKEVVEKAKNAVISVIEPEPHWIPCSEKMPSETVIATVETKAFKHRYVCEAVWIPRWTWKASFDEWEDCSEYNEDDDEYYVLEGWYERVHNWDEYAYVAIDDDVIAWMSMPIPYCGGGNGE